MDATQLTAPKARRAPGRSGFTLVELLCTLAIIAVLAGLLLGPVSKALSKARNLQWAETANKEFNEVVVRLRKLLSDRTDYPPVSLPELEALGVFTDPQLRFLHDRRVHFIPFGPADPAGNIVLTAEIQAGFLTSTDRLTATKGEVTQPLP